MHPLLLIGLVLASMVIGPFSCAEDTQARPISAAKGKTTSVALVCWAISIVVACGRFPSGHV